MSDVAARFVWKLARRHSWGSPVPAEELVRLATRTEDYDAMERTLEDDVLELPFVVQSPDGIHIPNGRDSHVAAANWLRKQTELDDLKIEATLSRLPDDWPGEE